jgi:TfoX/Sxy family transcriptional regulator of competence genes
MAYNPQLLERIRAILASRDDVVEKKMFGGVAFMVRGNMACGPHNDNLLVRIGEDAASRALSEPHVKPMMFTGKALKPFATVEAAGIKTDAQLRRWVEMSAAYAASLPSKGKPKRGRKETGNGKRKRGGRPHKA